MRAITKFDGIAGSHHVGVREKLGRLDLDPQVTGDSPSKACPGADYPDSRTILAVIRVCAALAPAIA